MNTPPRSEVPPHDDVQASTSLSLLDRVKAADQEAWYRLVRLYGPLVFQWCRREQLQDEDAADVSQEVFQAVAVGIGGFRRDRPGASFRGWLWTLTRNKIADHFRRRQRQPQAVGGSSEYERFQNLPAELSVEEQHAATHGLVHRALELIRAEFQERTWQAFWRSAVEDEATRAIADDLGVTPDAVRLAKSRVLRRLREELTDWYPSEPEA